MNACKDAVTRSAVETTRSRARCRRPATRIATKAAGCLLVASICAGGLRGDGAESKSAPARSTAVARPAVVATVNGQQITRSQLAQECLRRFGKDVLESTINKHLIWQECEARGVKIGNQDVNEEIERIAGKFGLAADRWLAMLQQERDISPEKYRREIIWPTLALRRLAAAQIQATDQEIQQAMETEYGPRVRARAITVSRREDADRLRALAVKDPSQFEDLAKKYSEDQSASVGGLIPPIRKHLGNVDLEKAAFQLQPGQISAVIPVANQFVILKCENQIPATYIPPKFQADAQMRVRDRVQDQKLRTTAAQLFQSLQQQAKVVNVWNDPQQRKRMPGVAAVINGQKLSIQQLAEECLARHGKEVLESEINRQILLQALRRNGQQVTDADIEAEIARAADAYGYVKPDGAPDVDRWLKDVTEEEGSTIDLYVRDAVWPSVALKKLVHERIQVTEEDLQKGFLSNYGARVETQAIVFSNQRQAQRVWEMARNNNSESFFGELAHEYSVDPISRENFGKIPPIRRYGGYPELEKEAFRLKAGELSGIIASQDKFVVLRCLGRTTPVVGQMDAEVKSELTKDLREKKLRMAMAVEFERLTRRAQIENLLAGTFQQGATSSQSGTTVARRGSADGSADGTPASRRR